MTFKELQKLIHHRQSESNSDQTRFFDRLKDKPFWIWDVREHKADDLRTKGDCCFNHIMGLPVKRETERPLYPYQKIIYDTLDKHKHIFIKKSTGLGISEFFPVKFNMASLLNSRYLMILLSSSLCCPPLVAARLCYKLI